MIKVVIAEDEPILRQALKKIMEEDGEISVCGVASDGKMAYDLCVREKPDVVLMDMKMPNGTGDQMTRKIKEVLPKTKVLAYTVFDNRATVTAACSSGVDSYILKGADDQELINAVKSAVKNAPGAVSYVSSEVFDMMKARFSPVIPSSNLTQKEERILSLLGNAKSNKEIAEALFCSEGSIKNDISRLLKKFNFRDRTQLAVYAVKNGWNE